MLPASEYTVNEMPIDWMAQLGGLLAGAQLVAEGIEVVDHARAGITGPGRAEHLVPVACRGYFPHRPS